ASGDRHLAQQRGEPRNRRSEDQGAHREPWRRRAARLAGGLWPHHRGRHGEMGQGRAVLGRTRELKRTARWSRLAVDHSRAISTRPLPGWNGTALRAFLGMPHLIRRILTSLGSLGASWAFGTVAVYALLWIILDPQSLNWHGVATLATWCMTLFIQ